jgi:hypothetical protein
VPCQAFRTAAAASRYALLAHSSLAHDCCLSARCFRLWDGLLLHRHTRSTMTPAKTTASSIISHREKDCFVACSSHRRFRSTCEIPRGPWEKSSRVTCPTHRRSGPLSEGGALQEETEHEYLCICSVLCLTAPRRSPCICKHAPSRSSADGCGFLSPGSTVRLNL